MSHKKQRETKTKRSKRTHEEIAEKALAAAGDAVAAARKATKKSRKKLKKKAAKLTRETQRMSTKLAKAQQKVSRAEAASAAVTAPPLSEAPDKATTPDALDPGTESDATTGEHSGAAELTPPLPRPERAPASLVELRREAKDRKIPRYSRLAKAELIAALKADVDVAPQE